MRSLKRGFATASGSETSPVFVKCNPPEQWRCTKVLRFVQEGAGGEGGLGRAKVSRVSEGFADPGLNRTEKTHDVPILEVPAIEIHCPDSRN